MNNKSINKRKRDTCAICKAKGRNPTGHEEAFCAYEGGPFFGRFKDAVNAKKSRKHRLVSNDSSEEIISLVSQVQTCNARELNHWAQIKEVVQQQREKINDQDTKIKNLMTTVKKLLAEVNFIKAQGQFAQQRRQHHTDY